MGKRQSESRRTGAPLATFTIQIEGPDGKAIAVQVASGDGAVLLRVGDGFYNVDPAVAARLGDAIAVAAEWSADEDGDA